MNMNDLVIKMSRLSPKELANKIESLGLDEKKLMYLFTHMNNHMLKNDIDEKIFCSAFSDELLDKMYEKHFKASKLSRCHSLSYDTDNFLKSMLYTDGMEELYKSLSNSIAITQEELLLTFIIGGQSGVFKENIKAILNKYKDVSDGSTN